MIDFSIFLKGVGVGTAIAASGIGPMSLLCMRRTLIAGWRSGLAIGGGIAIGDAIYGAVTALGLAGVSQFMLAHEKPLHLAAGLFLIYLELRSFWTARPMVEQTADPSALACDHSSIDADKSAHDHYVRGHLHLIGPQWRSVAEHRAGDHCRRIFRIVALVEHPHSGRQQSSSRDRAARTDVD
jgi:hypothetical protein